MKIKLNKNGSTGLIRFMYMDMLMLDKYSTRELKQLTTPYGKTYMVLVNKFPYSIGPIGSTDTADWYMYNVYTFLKIKKGGMLGDEFNATRKITDFPKI